MRTGTAKSAKNAEEGVFRILGALGVLAVHSGTGYRYLLGTIRLPLPARNLVHPSYGFC